MTVRIIRFLPPPAIPMPLYVHTVGYNKQSHLTRPDGFSTDQLLFARGGQGRVLFFGKETITFGPYQYMFMPAGLPHEYYPVSEEPWEVGYVSFAGDKADLLLEHFGLVPCRLTALTDAERVWKHLDDIWMVGDANDDGAEWEAVKLLYVLLADLNRLRLSEGKAGPAAAEGSEEAPSGDAVVQQAVQYLNEHYNENITLSNVAASLGYTHQYLNRLFHKTYGISMLQYVQKIRLDKAVGLMDEHEAITVKDIAGRIGMETNYFIRTFRKATGMTPGHFRRKRAGRT
ncbi:AraC family transcriptional regulator [Paenibacillus sp. MBLB4367]|uniref:helix-turn-helix transcriptional regulator n=1 Tax=Paenibacillus sp. MBLB4367 TaxID=3384767 RepID=UPI003907FBEE